MHRATGFNSAASTEWPGSWGAIPNGKAMLRSSTMLSLTRAKIMSREVIWDCCPISLRTYQLLLELCRPSTWPWPLAHLGIRPTIPVCTTGPGPPPPHLPAILILRRNRLSLLGSICCLDSSQGPHELSSRAVAKGARKTKTRPTMLHQGQQLTTIACFLSSNTKVCRPDPDAGSSQSFAGAIRTFIQVLGHPAGQLKSTKAMTSH